MKFGFICFLLELSYENMSMSIPDDMYSILGWENLEWKCYKILVPDSTGQLNDNIHHNLQSTELFLQEQFFL